MGQNNPIQREENIMQRVKEFYKGKKMESKPKKI